MAGDSLFCAQGTQDGLAGPVFLDEIADDQRPASAGRFVWQGAHEMRLLSDQGALAGAGCAFFLAAASASRFDSAS